MPCTRHCRARHRATTSTSARCRCCRRCSPTPSCTTAPTRPSASRDARPSRGSRHDAAAGSFVVTLQNHDQVGNRAVGDRLPEITTPNGLLKVGAVLLLTAPFTPMLWMGEEWAASTRWPFFTSHPGAGAGRGDGQGPHRGVRPARLGRQPDDRSAGRERLPQRDPRLGRGGRAVPTPRCSSLYRTADHAARRPNLTWPTPTCATSTSTSTRTSGGWSCTAATCG